MRKPSLLLLLVLALLALSACANTTEPSCGPVTSGPMTPLNDTLPPLNISAQMCVTPFNPWWECGNGVVCENDR